MDLPLSTITLSTGLALLLVGMWGMLTHKNIIRMIIGFSLMDTGVHMVMVSIGYLSGRTAPIINDAVNRATALQEVVDPVPSALVLTAIVIGLGITAVMLAFAVQIHEKKKSLSIEDCTESKW
ncbi:MAG: cation:proton antiporter subunit C [Chromatiales bacterium]|jgi:multicomponent Na+:H+ antiporter subunit C